LADSAGYGSQNLIDVVLAFSSETSYEKLLDIILTKMMELTNSDAGTLYLLEDKKLHFRIIKNKTLNISRSVNDIIDLPPIVLNEKSIENISAYSAINDEIVVVDDVYESQRFNFAGPKNYDKITGYRTRSMLVLPLTSYWNEKSEVMGVIQLLNAQDPKTGETVPFGDIYNPPTIPALANIASNTLANNMHLKDIRMLLKSFAAVMAKAIDERSKYNSNHTQKVTSLCVAFAQYLNNRFPEHHHYSFDEKRLDELSMAAMLHDIGKIVTPLNIMDKADRLGAKLPVVRYRFELKKYQLENDALKGHITEQEYAVLEKDLKDALSLVETATAAEVLNDTQIANVQNLGRLTYINPEGEISSLLDPDDIEALSISQGTLTKGEREIMKEHVSVTAKLLESIAFCFFF
jgi:HD-GYP domain-containing protein (c-di-GMP phosphodiesterase class II)